MIIGKREFDTSVNTYIMGILNVTEDSFSDGGRYNRLDYALRHAQQMVDEGADIIDVGGESTRPGYTAIPEEEEIHRVAPVIEAIKKNFDIPVSLDTYKAAVAAAGISAGADMINDIWGLQRGQEMARLIAKSGTACCLMHNRENAEYKSFLDDFLDDMRKITDTAKSFEIASDKVILDPGIGFAKSTRQNLMLINKMGYIREQISGYPWLLGTSRKSVIGNALGLPVNERLEGTLATTVFAVICGVAFVRVHDVKENRRVIAMARSIMESESSD